MSNSQQQPYFYNTETRQASWTKPIELTDEQIITLPGAEMLPSQSPKRSKPSGPVRASHILVKYNGSQNPVSRNPGNDVCILLVIDCLGKSLMANSAFSEDHENQIRGDRNATRV